MNTAKFIASIALMAISGGLLYFVFFVPKSFPLLGMFQWGLVPCAVLVLIFSTTAFIRTLYGCDCNRN